MQHRVARSGILDLDAITSTSARARATRAGGGRTPPDHRRRIIDAANRLLRERRYRDLTVEDVMDEAGLTRTVLYRYFDGIASIVLGLSEDLLSPVVAEGDIGDPTDREMMRRQLALAVDTFRESRCSSRSTTPPLRTTRWSRSCEHSPIT